MRKTENEEVNNIVLEFFIKCRAQNIPVTDPILQAKAAEILEDIMTGRVQGAPLDDEQEMEEEEVDQQPPNRLPSHSEALQHVQSLMQFMQSNLPHLQPTLINIQ